MPSEAIVHYLVFQTICPLLSSQYMDLKINDNLLVLCQRQVIDHKTKQQETQQKVFFSDCQTKDDLI